MRSASTRFLALTITSACAPAALAGPPFLTDDPAPTDYQHYEVYGFANGTGGRDGTGGAFGIDFNYGATPDLQLTAALPISYEDPRGGHITTGLGNIELAAKFRILHQEDVGVDVAVFPRLFLPSGSNLGDDHAAVLLPIWVGRSWSDWSTFGGGGCVINRGGDSNDFCQAGWAVTHKLLSNLQLGAEIFHQGADAKGGRASTILGFGATYDISESVHLLGYAGAGLQNTAETGRSTWYSSVLFTF